MAEADKDPAERINFAFAKRLFEADKLDSKSSLPTPSQSSGTQKLSTSENGSNALDMGHGENQPSSVATQIYSERGTTYGVNLSSAASDGAANAKKSNFIIPNKRGDTSDLKWLTSVQKSKPVVFSASEKEKSATNSSVRTIPSPAPSSDGRRLASTDVLDSNSVKLQSSYGNSTSSKDVQNRTKTTENQSWTNGNVNGNGENSESVVKSSMTVTLNTSSSGRTSKTVADTSSTKAEVKTTPGYLAVVDEIKARGTTGSNKQDQVKANGIGTTSVTLINSNEQNRIPTAGKTAPPVQPPLPPPPPSLPTSVPTPPPPSDAVSGKVPTTEKPEQEDGQRRAVKLVTWDPTKLMKDLYKITLQPDVADRNDYINIEGFLEKLPVSKTKDTFLKTWKRRFFRAHNGTLCYSESAGEKKESGSFMLNGGKVEDIGERTLGLEDGRGHYLILRCATDKDFNDWKRALTSQTAEGLQSTWTKPVLQSSKPNSKKVILLELGSCAVRAGILGESPSLPGVFLPTVVATHRETGQKRFCFDAWLPDIRACSTITYPIRPTPKVDKYSIDWDSVPGLFDHVFHQLNVVPAEYSVMFSIPTNFSDKIKAQFMDLFVNRFKVKAVSMTSQSILSLYSYNTTSGIIVDIGDRIEILPIADGYVVEGGVARVPYGGQTITDAFNRSFTDRRYRFSTDVEFQIVRLAMEKLCYVSDDFDADSAQYQENPDQFNGSLSLEEYNLPPGSFEDISNDLGRFQSPEGLFNTYFWGLDNPPLQELIQKAIQACPIDMRRQMWRSIYLSGGVTMLKGFPERLQKVMSKLAPSGVVVQVHAAPNRYHSSYLGAANLALMQAFSNGCISAEEWRQSGTKTLKKWKAY